MYGGAYAGRPQSMSREDVEPLLNSPGGSIDRIFFKIDVQNQGLCGSIERANRECSAPSDDGEAANPRDLRQPGKN